MSHFLFSLFMIPSIISPYYCELSDHFDEAIILKTYSDGEELEMSDEDLREFYNLFDKSLENSREMPAYCVSLHNETVEDMQSGIWARFIFPSIEFHRDMPFTELILKIEKDTSGVNVIRSNFGFLDGRCFYLDLENNFNELYDFLSGLEKIELPEADDTTSEALGDETLQTQEIKGEDSTDNENDEDSKSTDDQGVQENIEEVDFKNANETLKENETTKPIKKVTKKKMTEREKSA